jgi:hypothetical protein
VVNARPIGLVLDRRWPDGRGADEAAQLAVTPWTGDDSEDPECDHDHGVALARSPASIGRGCKYECVVPSSYPPAAGSGGACSAGSSCPFVLELGQPLDSN